MSDNSQCDTVELTLNEQIEAADKIRGRAPHESLALAEAIMRRAESEGNFHAYARALRVRASCYQVIGDMEASSVDLHACLEQAKLMNDPLLEAQCLHGLGNACFFKGDCAHALEYVYGAIAVYRQIGDKYGLMIGLNSLGAYLAELGDFTHAVAQFTDSVQIARSLSDPVQEAIALSNIGQAELDFGESERAIEHLTKSLELLRQADSTFYEAIALEKLAEAYHRSGRLEEALSLSEKAVKVCKDTGNRRLEVNALRVLATIQAEQGATEPAAQSLLYALHMAQSIEYGTKIAELYGALGKLYFNLCDFNSARRYLEEGVAYARKTEQKHLLSELFLALSELHSAGGDYKRSLECYRDYHEMYCVLQKESAQNRLAAQLANLELERAQQQAEIHRLRNLELVAANQRNTELLEHLQQHANQLTELAIKDPLTGLYNRRYLQDYLERELDRPHYVPRLSVAVADLDNFKQVNDRFSHLIGDEVLKVIAQLIRNSIRHSDVAVRFGGEEFVIVLPEMLRPGALEVCERVRYAIAAYDWPRIHPDLKMTTSIGVADTTEESLKMVKLATPVECLLALADQRLYRAKEFGKNQVL